MIILNSEQPQKEEDEVWSFPSHGHVADHEASVLPETHPATARHGEMEMEVRVLPKRTSGNALLLAASCPYVLVPGLHFWRLGALINSAITGKFPLMDGSFSVEMKG